MVAARVFRSSSACALPRPSATASAKFAKSTVNQSQAATRPAKTFSCDEESERFFSHRNVTSTLPSSTTNMTGLRAMRRGSSFRMLSPAARRRIAGSRSERGCLATYNPSCSRIGPRARTGKYVSPTMIRITPTRRPAKSGVPVGKVPAVTGTGCLRASAPAIARTSTMGRKRPASIARPSVVLYQSVFPVRPPNAEPLLFAAEVNA